MNLKTSARTWLFTTLLCILTAVTFAQHKNFYVDKTEPSWIVKLSPKAYKVKAKDVSDGYYLGLVERQNHAELKEEYRHFTREIISQTGVQNGSEISVTYDPGFQKLIFHKIIIWRNNHAIDKLVASKFKILQNEKERSKFIYSGTFDAYMILDDVRKGDRIEYAYTIKGQNPIFGDKYANTFYFEGSSSYGHEYTNLIVSNKRKLNFKNFNFDEKPVSHDIGGMRIFEWESTLTNTHRTPDYEPSWYDASKYTQVLNNIIIREMNQTQKMLETVVRNMIDQVLEEFPFLISAEVSIKKLNPPMQGQIGHSLVRLSYLAEQPKEPIGFLINPI